jgi:hypothetical protein
MNKKMLVNILLLFIVGMVITGCDGKEKAEKTLKCTKTSNSGMEVAGEATINATIGFDKNDKPKKANLEVIVNVDKIEVTEEKMKSLESHFKDAICGSEGYIPGDKCESSINGNKIVFNGKGDFNDIWYNYNGEEKIEEYKEFLESHEEMTCSIEE